MVKYRELLSRVYYQSRRLGILFLYAPEEKKKQNNNCATYYIKILPSTLCLCNALLAVLLAQ